MQDLGFTYIPTEKVKQMKKGEDEAEVEIEAEAEIEADVEIEAEPENEAQAEIEAEPENEVEIEAEADEGDIEASQIQNALSQSKKAKSQNDDAT